MQLKLFAIPGSDYQLYCDYSTSRIRPFITSTLRKKFLQATHNLSHPGTRATAKLMTSRFVWPNIRRDSIDFARSCIQCQRAKIVRHTKSPLQQYEMVGTRFAHINIDIVGPFPPSEGYRYCLTIIDRFSRWPEAIPIAEMSATTVAQALISGWIARFGIPASITCDQGRQFESKIFNELARYLGINHFRTTRYHPQANGIIERWHRTLKAAILCHDQNRWTKFLPLILLGLRTTYKEDIKASPAELVLGTTLRIPAEFFTPNMEIKTETEVLNDLREAMQNIRPQQTAWHGQAKGFKHPDLDTCTHVFLRNDSIRPSLSHPYEGPYQIIDRKEKFFKIRINRKDTNVSIDRLKPAYLVDESHPLELNLSVPAPITPSQPSTNTTSTDATRPTTSSDTIPTATTRHVRLPTRFL